MSSHSQKPTAERLLKLSGEVNRIAMSLAHLSAEPNALPPEKIVTGGQEADITAEEIGAVIYRRRQRGAYLPPDLFADPAWDMMLDLFRAELMCSRQSISRVCMASGVPATTALRWLNTLENKGIVVRRADPLDRRRVFVELTQDASSALRQWFTDSFGETA